MKEREIEEKIARFRRIIGPVASTMAAQAAAEVGVSVSSGHFIGIDNEQKYKALLNKIREKFSKIIGSAVTDTLMSQ